MGYDIVSVLKLLGICALTFWLIGSCMLLVAVRKARREFRVKGYLRPPSGTHWFRFLLMKHYDAFDDPGARFFFGLAHLCMMGLIITVAAALVLVVCDQLLKRAS